MIKTQHCPNCEATEQKLHDFQQEVSDVVESITSTTVDDGVWRGWASDRLSKFIIPKPKPDSLVDVAESLGYFNTAA